MGARGGSILEGTEPQGALGEIRYSTGANRVNTSKERRPFEPAELEKLLGHLAYEWLMLEYTRYEWKVCRQRYVLEALLLHCRNLRDFLFGSIELSDVHVDKALFAADYAPSWCADP